MTELQNTATATVEIATLKNKDLQKACKQIVEIGRKTTENIYMQFNLMADIYHKELFKDDFPVDNNTKADSKKKAFGNFAKKVFGIDVSTAYKMVRVSDEYLHGKSQSILCDKEGNDFTPSALMELLERKEQGNNKGFTVKDVQKAVNEGIITSDDTIKDLRETVKTQLRGIRPEPKTEKKNEVVKSEIDITVLIAELKSYANKKNDTFLIKLANRMNKAVAK